MTGRAAPIDGSCGSGSTATALRSLVLGKMPPAYFWTPRKDPLHLEVLRLTERLIEEGNLAKIVIDEHAVHGSLRARHQFRFAEEAFQCVCAGMAAMLGLSEPKINFVDKTTTVAE